MCGAALPDCRSSVGDFVRVSENGFDPVDHARDKNDYPWSMEYFVPDGEDEGFLYVGTGNNFVGIALYVTFPGLFQFMPRRPPEIRRYRPALGARSWERVLDMADVEVGPAYETMGFRMLRAYRSQADGRNYLYAGTFGAHPSIWRSATGEPGSWTEVFRLDAPGSMRWMAEHNGLLYIASTVEDMIDDTARKSQGLIIASDGESFTVVQDGNFGNLENLETVSLVSYGGWLYAGTRNKVSGFQIWKFAGPPGEGSGPVLVVDDGGVDPLNETAGTPYVFNDYLFYGTMIFGGITTGLEHRRGCDLIRIDRDGQWDVVVGPGGLSSLGPGFGEPGNAYLWMMEEHEGWLYAGTWDESTSLLQGAVMGSILGERVFGASGRNLRNLLTLRLFSRAGADLYRSRDGILWQTVFKRGLGNPNNYGIRTMHSVGDELFVGMANPYNGLEIWKMLPGPK